MSSGFPHPLTIQTSFEPFSDSRTHGHQGPTRNVRLPRACSSGAGVLSKSEDGTRCAVTGKESLKILRMSDPSYIHDNSDSIYKTNRVGKGGYRVDASKNYWEGSGLKIDSASTDIAWCREQYSTKILTSARNGELIMWDINKSGSKYERRSKDHLRSIHKLSVSPVVSTYCITGSSDGDLRVWDLRDFQRSIMRIHHTAGVRGVVFSPVVWSPLQAVVGLENGNIFRWDLKMGQRGQLDRIAVAHTASVMSLDWCSTSSATPNMATESTGNGYGWIVSGGLDRCVKVWDLTSLTANPSSHIPHKPAYTLHPSFPVRRVLFRPSYDCEIAIISNAEFGSGSNPDIGATAPGVSGTPPTTARALPGALQTPLVSQGAPGVLSRIGSGIGLDLVGLGDLRGEAGRNHGRQGSRTGRSPTPTSGSKASSMTSNTGIGDAAEIWDARRGWIAKWSVTGSAVDGGVTDITFGDSHTLWAQHWSGMFSQIDLRDATKPLDAIPRVATTWESSGCLTFVADAKSKWEVPYDDVRPEARKAASERGSKQRALGDAVYQNTSQNVGTFCTPGAASDIDVFAKLARRYIIDGDDRSQICTVNAQAAFQAGHPEAAQVWLLVAASLTDLIPKMPSKRHHSSSAPPQEWTVPVSAPATLTSRNTKLDSSPGRSSMYGSDKASSNQNNQIAQRSRSSASRQRRTPGSSANSSPHQGLTPLLPLTPTITRYPSHLSRRTSVDAGNGTTPHALLLSRRPSMLRRPSTSTHSASPSNLSLKHVGEGALDDSDSSSSSGSGRNDRQDLSDDDAGSNGSISLISPALANPRIAHPSPLSRMIDHKRWIEDEDGKDEAEDEASSPSPRSTDSESGDDANADVTGTRPPKARRLLRRSSNATKKSSKSRSRSGTVDASLIAVPRGSSAPSGRVLAHRESSSSIRTVTAGGDTSYGDSGGLKVEETIKDIRDLPLRHSRDKSLAVSDLVLGSARGNNVIDEDDAILAWTHRDAEVVESEEKKLREVAWEALRETFEDFANLGDVQTCAMLVLIVAQELAIRPKRALIFVDSYIEHLTRLRLFTSASYIRKHSRIEEIRSATLTETVIYTACGRCRKAFAVTPQQAASRSYIYCSRCRSNTITCSICRLPVRGLLFQCSVCAHGGHQLCYRTYYKQRPMVNLSGSTTSMLLPKSEVRGRSTSRSNASTVEDDEVSNTSAPGNTDALHEDAAAQSEQSSRFFAHPCAAGCGHHCWISCVSSENC